MTNEEIIQRGILIRDETEPAQNTSERVGSGIEGIGRNLADKDTAIAAEAARNGYYQCTVNSNQLAVTAPGFTLPAHGGNIRIKMSAPATGASTLNINGTGAKALLYNGAAVSSTNTWEQNEIISVFYDPSGSGQYLASNSQGGGGKASKIKYDNSQSGLAAENVQEALDELDEKVSKQIDLNSEWLVGAYIEKNTGKKKSYSGMYYTNYIPVKQGDKVYNTGVAANSGQLLSFYTSESESSYVGSLASGATINTDGYIRAHKQYATGNLYMVTTLKNEIQDIKNEVDGLSSELIKNIDYSSLWISGGYIEKNTGVLKSASGQQYTDYIAVYKDEVIYNTGSAANKGQILSFYSDKTESSYVGSLSSGTSISTNGYVRAHRQGTTGQLYATMSISAEMSAMQSQIDECVNEDDLQDAVKDFKTSDEFSDKYVSDKYVDTSGNIISSTASGWVALKVDVTGLGGYKVAVKGASASGSAFSGFVVSGGSVSGRFYGGVYGSGTETIVTIPSGAQYLCVSFNPGGQNGDAANGYYVKMVAGSKNTYLATRKYIDDNVYAEIDALNDRISGIEVSAGLLPANTKMYVLGDSISMSGHYMSVGEHWYDLIVAKNHLTFVQSTQALAVSGWQWTPSSSYGTMYQEAQSIGSDATLIAIWAGVNDLGHGCTLGNMEYTDGGSVVALQSSISNCNTFYRAVCFTLNYLLTNFPNAKVAVILPTKANTGSYAYNTTTQMRMEDIWGALEECCNFYGIPIIPLGKEIGINPVVNTADCYRDGLHLNVKGQRKAAGVIEAYLKNILNAV